MAVAALQNTGRSEVKERQEAMAQREQEPAPRAKVTVFSRPTEETDEERRTRHALETGTRRSLWR